MKSIHAKFALWLILTYMQINPVWSVCTIEKERDDDASYLKSKPDEEEIPGWFSSPNDSYTINKAGVYKYATLIMIEKQQLKDLEFWRQKYAKDHDDCSMDKIIYKMARIREDLERDRGHFNADKTALKYDYLETINMYKEVLRDLIAERKNLKEELIRLNKTDVEEEIVMLENLISIQDMEIRYCRNMIKEEKNKLKTTLRFVNDMAS